MANGPLSKFDEKEPELRTISPVPLHDLERCLMDLKNHPLPMVIRQPDRPDNVTLVYYVQMRAMDRIDLKRTPSGTEVVAWQAGNQAKSCISTGKRQ